jgi:hypothetical protein
MELFAVFETWHIGDGNYPPLSKGQLVNLSFEVEPDEIQLVENTSEIEFLHLGHAVYQFTGKVLRVYNEQRAESRIIVVETGSFRFYLHSYKALLKASTFRPGNVINGRGVLLLDHYLWVEFLSSYADPPDLFYTLRVDDIWRYRIPERFIKRSDRGIAYPTRVRPEDYGPDDVTKVDLISDDGFTNFVVQFSDRDIPSGPIARTFCS